MFVNCITCIFGIYSRIYEKKRINDNVQMVWFLEQKEIVNTIFSPHYIFNLWFSICTMIKFEEINGYSGTTTKCTYLKFNLHAYYIQNIR